MTDSERPTSQPPGAQALLESLQRMGQPWFELSDDIAQRWLTHQREQLGRAANPAELGSSAGDPATRAALPLFALADQLERNRSLQRLSEAGWVPSPLLPLKEWLERSFDESGIIDEWIQQWVDAQWPWMRRMILENPAFETLGEEPRETLRQAVEAHDQTLYRCVPRTVFGEVEGCARRILGEPQANPLLEHSVSPLRHAFELMPHGAMPGMQDLLRGDRQATFRDSLNSLIFADLAFRTLALVHSAEEDSP